MGLFKTKETNFFKQIANEIASQEEKKVLLDSPFLKGRQLILNRDGILSFVIAVFAIEMKLNPKLQGVSLKNEYRIDTEEYNYKAYELFYTSIYKCIISDSTRATHALWKIAYAYLENVWGIEDKIPDPVLLTSYSMYLAQVRNTIKERIENSLPDLVEP